MTQNFVNNSGQGKGIQVPQEILGQFNWGAFLLNWLWGLGNASYITLLVLAVAFVPFVGFILSLAGAIWCGIKGNEMAWQNKYFESIDAFHSYQKKWAIAGVIVLSVFIVLSVIMSVFLFGAALFLQAGK